MKLHSILKTTTVTEILTNPRQVTQAVEKELEEWVTRPWLMPAVYIWGQIIHKYQGMTEMIQAAFHQTSGSPSTKPTSWPQSTASCW